MNDGDAVVLVAHGSVDELDELPEFLANIRRGLAPSPELLAEVRRRYEAIGGRSPLNAINRTVAVRLEERLGVPVRLANRLFRPYPKEVLEDLALRSTKRVIVVPLAQHSARVYGDAVAAAAKEARLSLSILAAPNWGRTPQLIEAFAQAIVTALPADVRDCAILMTAHSLPTSVVDAGDPYETELRASAEAVARRVREIVPHVLLEHRVAFQSQGLSTGPGGRAIAWLGPDLRLSLEELASRGIRTVLVAPIGFLADHVEILYDLDIEAMVWAKELGISLHRSASLNASEELIESLAAVAQAVADGLVAAK